jgi:CubicO group peptidase (beta-lactamase class C family)
MTHSPAQAALDRLHTAMAARVERRELPGIVVLVAQGDHIHLDCIGATRFDAAEQMRRETPFRITSMTKPVLAAATMMLVEDGQLDLDEPVDKWLPELANRRVLRHVDGPLDDTEPAKRPITLDDLLTFRLGFGMLVEPTFDPPVPIVQAGNALELVLSAPEPRTPHAPDAWMARFGSLPLMYQPGERWLYNVGSLLLGVLVARVAHQSLGDFFQARIFDPLHMLHTGFCLPAEVTRQLPAPYMTDPDTGQLAMQSVSSPEEWSRPPVFPSGAAGLVSTADDFLAFARLLLSRGVHNGTRLLSEASVESMTTNHLTPEQIASAGPILGGRGWGYGVGVVLEPDAAWPVPGRYGWPGGYGTIWFNDPHRDIVAIAMSQTSDVLWNGVVDEFDRLVAGI